MEFSHEPVMPNETIEYLSPAPGEIFVDGTLGGGGHAKLILDSCKNCKVIGIDQDTEAINYVKEKLSSFSNRLTIVKDNFVNIDSILSSLKLSKVDGILLDLGTSTHQLISSQRGFSFAETEENIQMPLDMRMDMDQEFSAYNVVNEYSEEELFKIIKEYGEEPMARRIAKGIVETRNNHPIATIGDLLGIIRKSTPPKYRYSRHRHWASKTFRAIRIEVNSELEVIKEVLPKVIESLEVGGRFVIISFHSLEDRIVKHYFKDLVKTGEFELLTKKPVVPTEAELAQNIRAQSAKLRAIKRIK